MSDYFKVKRVKQLVKINYVLIAIFIAVSLTSHVIAYRLISLDGLPLIPSSFVYMAAFVITDIFASYNSRRFVVVLIILEAIVNLFFILVTNIVISLPAPKFLHNPSAYNVVLSPILNIYLANLLGTFAAFLLDLFLFYFLYKKHQWMFFGASFLSSAITICFYTFITDYFAFSTLYPHWVFELSSVNLLTNIFSLLIYSLLGQITILLINKKLYGYFKFYRGVKT